MKRNGPPPQDVSVHFRMNRERLRLAKKYNIHVSASARKGVDDEIEQAMATEESQTKRKKKGV
jgi:hypothetical protein